MTQKLTQDRLKQLLNYDPGTGKFTWKARPITAENSRTDNVWNTRFAGKSSGWARADGYLGMTVDRKKHQAHRLAWLYVYGAFPVGDLDHKNGVRSDNAIGNLRESSRSQNTANGKVRVTNKIGLKGVSQINGGRFYARVNRGSRRFYLGSYDTAEAAHAAYCYAAQKLFGEFSNAGDGQ